MEYTVVKTFIDRDSLKTFRAGDKFACPDDKRAAYLAGKGYLDVPIKDPVPVPKTAKPKTAAKRPAKKKESVKK